MNVFTYIFGKFQSGYTQYPDSNKKDIFQSVADKLQSRPMIAIIRDGNLIYNIYTRKIHSTQGDSQYIGLAFVLNEVYFNDLSKLFSLFDETLTSIVLTGKILEFNDNGYLVAKISQLYSARADVEKSFGLLSAALEKLPSSSFKSVPPVNYSIEVNESTSLADTSSPEIVAGALNNYNVLYAYRVNDISSLNEYSNRLHKLNLQIAALTSENAKLSTSLSKAIRQKKRTTAVTILSLTIGLVLLFFFNMRINLSNQIYNLTNNIENLKQSNRKKDATIKNQTEQIQYYTSKLKTAETTLTTVQKDLENEKAQNAILATRNSNLNIQISSLKSQLSDLKENYKKDSNPTRSSSSSYTKKTNPPSGTNSEMYLSHESVSLSVGEKKAIDAYNYGASLKWESGNPKIATVSSIGIITGVSAGITTIRAIGKDYKICVVTVK